VLTRAEAAAILGVPTSASEAEARKSYLTRARLLHPDRFAGAPESDVQAATEAMAQLNAAFAVFRGDAQFTADEEPTPPPPPPPSAGSDAAGQSGAVNADACSLCGYAPAVRVKFHTVTGLILFWRWGTLDGLLCRRCGEAMYNESQRSTLLKGWWGLIAPIATVIAFLGNLSRIGTVRRLSEPQFRVPGAPVLLPHPMVFSRPWFKRPASLLSTGIALLVIAFIIAALLTPTSRSSAPPASDAPTIALGSCWFIDGEGVYNEVACDDSRATMKVTKSVSNFTACGYDYLPDNDGEYKCMELLTTAPVAQAAAPSASAEPSPPSPSVDGVPLTEVKTCIKGGIVENTCQSGSLDWTYSYCWDLASTKVQLQVYRGGKWQTEDEITAKKDSAACEDGAYPYPVEFTQTETALGSTRYRVRVPAAGYAEEFTATVTAPAAYFRTCVETPYDERTCADGLAWETVTCWNNASGAVVQYKSGGTWKNGQKAKVTRDTDYCDNNRPWKVVAKGTAKAPGDFSYRLFIPANSNWDSGSMPIEVAVTVK